MSAERDAVDPLHEAAQAVLVELDIIRRQPDDERPLRVHPLTHDALRAALASPAAPGPDDEKAEWYRVGWESGRAYAESNARIDTASPAAPRPEGLARFLHSRICDPKASHDATLGRCSSLAAEYLRLSDATPDVS